MGGANVAITTSLTSHKIKSILLEKQEEKTFELRLWVDEDVTWEEGGNKKYSAKIVTDTSPVQDISLVSMIRSLYPKVQSTLTVPGQAVSTSDEALLAETEDDYGTSYYFRGNVKNNYVQFANKCWRIVRITGNGAIKLVLHNDNVNNVSNPCNAVNNDTLAAYARYEGTTYQSAFNKSSNSNAYVGFMYGNPDGTTYSETHANINKSTILQNLEKWYIRTLTYTDENNVIHEKDIVNKLADVIWCNDKSTVQDTTYNPYYKELNVNDENYGVGKNINYYSTSLRLISSTCYSGGTGPSLVCPNDDNGGKLSKFTVDDTTYGNGNLTYKIGLLTADEIVFAGNIFYTNNYTFYLYENAQSPWWTMSPINFTYYTQIYGEIRPGYLHSPSNLGKGLRPSIALVSTTTIISGNGTSSDPFVISVD